LLEVIRIIGEQAYASHRLVQRRFIARTDSLEEIVNEESSHAVCVGRRDGAMILAMPARRIAPCAAADALTNQEVTVTEDLMTDDARATEIL
jgi:hypothetical protein